MKEYWLNIYDHNNMGLCHKTRQEAALAFLNGGIKPLYRIHVKMKNLCNHDSINEEYFK